MSLASIVVFYTLTMLTIAHADRGRPTLKDDERFRNGLVRDLNENTKTIYMNAKTIYMNSKRKKLNRNTSINLKTMLYENSCLMSLDCSNAVNRSRKNVDEVNLQVALIGKHDAVLILHEDTRYMNAVWKYVTSICIEVTVIFVICFIFACIFVYCGTNVMQNKVYAIQEFIFSSSVYLLSIVLPSDIPISLEDPKFSQLSVQVDSESRNVGTKECRSQYDKFIMIEVKYKRHLCRRDREPSRIPGKKLSRLLKKSRKLRKLVRKHI